MKSNGLYEKDRGKLTEQCLRAKSEVSITSKKIAQQDAASQLIKNLNINQL